MFALVGYLFQCRRICEITGLNGKVTGPSSLSEESLAITEQRELLVQFMTHNNESMPGFLIQKNQMRVGIGNQYEATFVFIIQLERKW